MVSDFSNLNSILISKQNIFASIIQEGTQQIGFQGWLNLAVVLSIVFILAIFMILHAQKSPENAARYHLDHHPHEGSSDHADEPEATPEGV